MAITVGVLSSLQHEVAFKRTAIVALQGTISKYSQQIDQGSPNEAFVTTVAANMMRFYTGVEDILEQILKVFDEFQHQGDSWHQTLLISAQTATRQRPAIIGRATFDALNDLRGFRHIVQKAYATPFDWDKMKHLAESVQGTLNGFLEDLDTFDRFLYQAIDALS